MNDIRIPVSEARRELAAGRAILACAYDDPEKCRPVSRDALPLAELRNRLATLPATQQIFLLCG